VAEARDYPEGEALDALMIVVAELLRAELFTPANLASIKRRLELSGHDDLAERIATLPIANAIDDPGEIRAHMRLVDDPRDGGNGSD
jgi:hypothetical protein